MLTVSRPLGSFRSPLTLLTTANLDDPRPINEQASTVTTIVRPLMAAFPTGFEAAAKTAKGRSLVVAKDEKALLDKLLGEYFWSFRESHSLM